MSLHRLSAGSGYTYVLRHVASADSPRPAGRGLADYYATTGTPPGRWCGAGLAGLADGRGLRAGAPVEEQQMVQLFGHGHDPITGRPLGRAYPRYAPFGERIRARADRLPTSILGEQREAALAVIRAEETARPVRQPVAGFDLTFTVPKSVSVLLALADDPTRRLVVAAHRDAVTAVLQFLQDHAIHTRVGAGGCAQVPTRGVVAAAFEHVDSRTGDPNLHTHLVIANKVQGLDGRWRSLDSRALHHAIVAASELYDDLLADTVTARLPVRFGWRARGQRRNPAHELHGIDEQLLAGFSTRATQIDQHLQPLLVAFHAEHGRRPTGAEMSRLRQHATRASRPAKQHTPFPQLLVRWRAHALRITGRAPQAIVAGVLTGSGGSWRWRDLPSPLVDQATQLVLQQVQLRRATWTRWNVFAEAARITRNLPMRTPRDRLTLLQEITDRVLSGSLRLDPPELFTVPQRYRRPDGTSVFTRPEETRYSTPALVEAEDRLLAAAQRTDAPTVPADLITRTLQVDHQRRLTVDQQAAVEAVAGSGRQVDVLVGPAGSGKTAALAALRQVWEAGHGAGSVRGLAPSATAAHEFAEALGVACENTAKWLHETDGPGADTRAQQQAILTHTLTGTPDPATRARTHRRLADLAADTTRWQLREGSLLIVDEASLAGTLTLDRLRAQVQAAGAKLLLVGDHHQLSAVDAGGVFRLLARRHPTAELTLLWRFRHRWEAHATRALRHGSPQVLDVYLTQDRIRSVHPDDLLDQALSAWVDSDHAGTTGVLLAADRRTVTDLNLRVHTHRVTTGQVQPGGVILDDRGTAGVGDRILTCQNDRRLRLPGGGHVRNGMLWTITDTHADGSLTVTLHRTSNHRPGSGEAAEVAVHLPASYVAEHVDLGYATTVHRAQGVTVDHAHLVVTPGMSRQAFYVGMTRGRASNTCWVASSSTGDDGCPHPPQGALPTDVRAVLEQILANDAAERAAHDTITERQQHATDPERLLAIQGVLQADADRQAWLPTLQQLLPDDGWANSPALPELLADLREASQGGQPVREVLPHLSRGLHPTADVVQTIQARLQRWLDAAADREVVTRRGRHTTPPPVEADLLDALNQLDQSLNRTPTEQTRTDTARRPVATPPAPSPVSLDRGLLR
jgi:conjugative relaxase-like TrwC/TraI family protein